MKTTFFWKTGLKKLANSQNFAISEVAPAAFR